MFFNCTNVLSSNFKIILSCRGKKGGHVSLHPPGTQYASVHWLPKWSSHHPTCHPPTSPSLSSQSISAISLCVHLSLHEKLLMVRQISIQSQEGDNFKPDNERAALFFSGTDNPGSKKGTWVDRKRTHMMINTKKVSWQQGWEMENIYI